mmetsp:Transcript_51586/g.116712  ORF Transcript_51586/g.116712 Transcript_51586/m.116712 type:complete len:336 (-) Transcript_51586:148-1155(-)
MAQAGQDSLLSDEDDDFGVDDPEAANTLNSFTHSYCGERRNSISAAPVSDARIRDWKGPPVHAKSPEESARIKDTIDRSGALQVLFGHLSGDDLQRIIGAMFLRPIQVGEVVIQQGADGDFFYIVDSGTYDIWVQRKADMPPERVMVATDGMSFGELALMYNVPRAATVQCVEAGCLWCLEREVFQMMLVTAENSKKTEFEDFLRGLDLFSDMNAYELSKLSDCMTSELFDGGEDIVTQGQEESAVYFLYEGECKAYMNGPQGEVEVKHYTQPGECFGEIAMFANEPRRATVRACGDGCVVLCLKKEDVTISVGSMETRIMENIHKYPQYEAYFR